MFIHSTAVVVHLFQYMQRNRDNGLLPKVFSNFEHLFLKQLQGSDSAQGQNGNIIRKIKNSPWWTCVISTKSPRWSVNPLGTRVAPSKWQMASCGEEEEFFYWLDKKSGEIMNQKAGGDRGSSTQHPPLSLSWRLRRKLGKLLGLICKWDPLRGPGLVQSSLNEDDCQELLADAHCIPLFCGGRKVASQDGFRPVSQQILLREATAFSFYYQIIRRRVFLTLRCLPQRS